MARRPPKNRKREAQGDTRRELLAAAKRLFARKGLDGATVKEIANAAGVNVSLISYHFDGKEGLYRACLEQFGKERLASARRLLTPAGTLEEFRLRVALFLGEMLTCHVDERDLVQMMHRECASETVLTQGLFNETFLMVFVTLMDFIKAGQKAGIVRKELDPKIIGGTLAGSISHLARVDYVNRKYFNQTIADPKYREKVVQQLVTLFLDGAVETADLPLSQPRMHAGVQLTGARP